MVTPVNEYTQQLKHTLEEAFLHIREKHKTAHLRRKEVYDQRAPYERDDLV